MRRKRLIDTNPGRGLLRFLVRLPIWLYRAHVGWLLGNRFLLLKHVGRKSGLTRRTVLEVVRYDQAAETWIIASGWGENSQWYKNIHNNPAVELESGWRRARATARRLSKKEAKGELSDYARRHPIAFRWLARRMLGRHEGEMSEKLHLLAETIPLIALQPEKEWQGKCEQQ